MPSLAELAENANTYTPLGPTDERIVTDRYVLWMGRGDEPGWNVAQRFRLRPTRSRRSARRSTAHLRGKGRTACTWEIGTHATPDDLVDRLLALGLVDDEPTPLAVGMVLTEPPAAAAARRRGTPGDRPGRNTWRPSASPRSRSAARSRRRSRPSGSPIRDNVVYLAYVDGEPVARGSASFSEHGVSLFGGSTLPEARGRGAYRALVAARWEDAVARGTPALVTQASPMSRPILGRLGFRELCEIRILLDRFEAGRMRVSAKADYAIRAAVELAAGGGGPDEGRPDRAGAGDPGQLPREHPRRPAQRGPRREPPRRRRRLLARAARRARSASPT